MNSPHSSFAFSPGGVFSLEDCEMRPNFMPLLDAASTQICCSRGGAVGKSRLFWTFSPRAFPCSQINLCPQSPLAVPPPPFFHSFSLYSSIPFPSFVAVPLTRKYRTFCCVYLIASFQLLLNLSTTPPSEPFFPPFSLNDPSFFCATR